MRTLTARDATLFETARSGSLLLGRDDLVAVVASGADQRKFLHAMLTQDVKGLADGTVRPTCLCDAQGAMVAIAWQVLQPERTVLWTARQTAELLRDGLDKFVIMDDVSLDLDEEQALIQLVGPAAIGTATSAGLAPPIAGTAAAAGSDAVWVWQTVAGGAPGSPLGDALPSVWIALPREQLGDTVGRLVEAGATVGSHAACDTLRIASGWPLLGGRDIDDGSLPLEAGLKGAVDYRKGCYLGQEAIAMMTYRGQIRRHLCWVERASSDQGGDALAGEGWQLRTADGKRAGRMGTSVLLPGGRWVGLAMVQRKAYAAGAVLTATAPSGETATVRIVATTVPQVLDSAEGA